MWLNLPNPVAVADGKEVEAKKVKQAIYKARQQEIQSTVSEKRWQGKLIKNRWDDENVKLEGCFAWLSSWCAWYSEEGYGSKHQESVRESYYDRDSKDLHAGICTNPQKGVQCMNRMIDLSD